METEHESKFQNHAVHSELDQLIEFLDDYGDESDENAKYVIERTRQVTDYVKARLGAANPSLSPILALDTINKQVSQIKGELNNFKSNRNVGHLSQVNNHLDNALIANSQLVVPLGDNAEANLLAVTERFREHSQETLRQIKEKIDAYSSRISDLDNAINSRKSELEGLARSVQSEKERVDSVVSEFQRTSQEREDRRTNQFNEVLARRPVPAWFRHHIHISWRVHGAGIFQAPRGRDA